MARDKEKKRAYDAVYTRDHKEEKRAYDVVYRLEHQAELKAYGAAYRLEHRAEIKVRNAAYRLEHIKEEAANRAAYYQENRDEVKSRNAAFYHAHREARRVHRMIAIVRSDEKKVGVTDLLNLDEWLLPIFREIHLGPWTYYYILTAERPRKSSPSWPSISRLNHTLACHNLGGFVIEPLGINGRRKTFGNFPQATLDHAFKGIAHQLRYDRLRSDEFSPEQLAEAAELLRLFKVEAAATWALVQHEQERTTKWPARKWIQIAAADDDTAQAASAAIAVMKAPYLVRPPAPVDLAA